MSSLELTAVFVKNDWWYAAYIAEITGINSQWTTLEEAQENLNDAFEMMMEYRREKAEDEHSTTLFSFNPLLQSYHEKTSTHQATQKA